MDYRFSFQRPMRRNSFCSMKGTIVDLVPAGQGGRRADGCLLFAAIEDTDGNTVNFFINPDTYVVDFTTLSVGMMATFWYRNDAPMPLIYPPQYTAVVDIAAESGRYSGCAYCEQPVFPGESREPYSGGHLFLFHEKHSCPDHAVYSGGTV